MLFDTCIIVVRMIQNDRYTFGKQERQDFYSKYRIRTNMDWEQRDTGNNKLT